MVDVRRYPAALVRVIDGDTMIMRVDHGMNISSEQHLRLLGTSCPELDEPDGLIAKQAAERWFEDVFTDFPIPWPCIIETVKNRSGDEKRTFIRYLATIYAKVETRSLNQWLVDEGHGVVG